MFGFPVSEKPESLRFANNSLQTANFQVSYPAVNLEAKQDEIVTSIQTVLPQAKGILQRTLTVTSKHSSKTPVFSSEGTPSGLEFTSEDNGITFTIKSDSMHLGMLGEVYTHFADAQKYLDQTFYIVSEILGINSFNRVAVRKINIIGSKPAEDSERRFDHIMDLVFNDALIGPAMLTPAASHLVSTVTNCIFAKDQNHLNLIYGILPQEMEQGVRQILLDIDIFNLKETTTVDEARSMMANINNEIFNVFMWALKPGVKSILLQQTL